METFDQIDNLLNNAKAVHQHAVDLYLDLRREHDDQRLQLLLDKMIAREQRLARIVNDYAVRAERNVRDTYLQYTQQQSPEQFVSSLQPGAQSISVEQLAQIGEALHHYQVDLLEGALRQVNNDSCEALLEELLHVEQAEKRNFSLTVEGNREM